MIKSLKSRINDNEYILYKDRIEVKRRGASSFIPLPISSSSYMYELEFYEILYMSGKLNVVIATRGDYDERYEIDEDTLELMGPAPFY